MCRCARIRVTKITAIGRPSMCRHPTTWSNNMNWKTAIAMLIIVLTGWRETTQGGDAACNPQLAQPGAAVPPSEAAPKQMLANEAYRLVVQCTKDEVVVSLDDRQMGLCLAQGAYLYRAERRGGKQSHGLLRPPRRLGRRCRPPLDDPRQAGRARRGAQLRLAGRPADHGRADRRSTTAPTRGSSCRTWKWVSFAPSPTRTARCCPSWLATASWPSPSGPSLTMPSRITTISPPPI